jgi:hypothetical protein
MQLHGLEMSIPWDIILPMTSTHRGQHLLKPYNTHLTRNQSIMHKLKKHDERTLKELSVFCKLGLLLFELLLVSREKVFPKYYVGMCDSTKHDH